MRIRLIEHFPAKRLVQEYAPTLDAALGAMRRAIEEPPPGFHFERASMEQADQRGMIWLGYGHREDTRPGWYGFAVVYMADEEIAEAIFRELEAAGEL